MAVTLPQLLKDLTLEVSESVEVDAPPETTFEALLVQMGPENETPDGSPLPMVLEPWPGGRWFRDLGGGDGHHWGHVQAIKRPTLLEINGPLFMSYPVVSNLQYRLAALDGGTRIALRHTALGVIAAEHRAGLAAGWRALLDRVRRAGGA